MRTHDIPRRSRARRAGLVVATIAALVGLAAGAGCRDELAAPTQGFLRVEIDGASDASVFVDDEARTPDADGRIGPLDAGTYRVTVERECFAVEPAAGVEVTVEPAESAVAHFLLEAREFGSALVMATDEVTGEAIAGAAIWLEDATGTLQDTGLTTPAIVPGLPCGPASFVIRLSGYSDAVSPVVSINTGVETPISLEMRIPSAVLAEMFTYLTCPNCPPAAEALQHEFDTRGGRAYVIEWHTRPPLPMWDQRWLEREEYYEGIAGSVLNLYPAVLFQGEFPWLIDGDAGTIAQYPVRIDEELVTADASPVAIRAEGTITPVGGGATAAVTVRLKWRGGALPADLRLHVVLLGQDIPYGDGFHFVPHDQVEEDGLHNGGDAGLPIAFTSTAEFIEISVNLEAPPPIYTVDHWDWVAFLQAESTGQILAVSGSH